MKSPIRRNRSKQLRCNRVDCGNKKVNLFTVTAAAAAAATAANTQFDTIAISI